MAENERVNIRQRQAEGIAAAKARGGALRAAAQATSGKFPQRLPEMEGRKTDRHRRRQGVRNAAVHLPLPGGNLRKSHVIKMRADLQKGVLFCKLFSETV